MPFVIPDLMDEPFTRLMLAQPQLAAFMLDSGVYLFVDGRMGSLSNPTACTDGARWIRVNPEFMKACMDGSKGARGSDIFVLAHEIMHVMLMHYHWMRSVRKHGFLVSTMLASEIRKFNPHTKWKAGDVIPARMSIMQMAMDYVINALLDGWGLRIRPYQTLLDHKIALPTDSEDTAYCRLIGRFRIEKENREPSSAPSSLGPGDGGEDMVEPYEGDMQDVVDVRLDEITRKIAVEKFLNAMAAKGQGSGAGNAMRLLDRLIPSPIKWRQHVRAEIKAASGRGQATWNRTSTRGLAMRTALPGHISRQSGTLVIQGDSSGSIGEVEIMQMAGCCMEVMKQVYPKRLIILDVDYSVQQVREPKNANELYQMLMQGFKGGGGTRMEAGFEWCIKHKIRPDTIITITDGYTSWPDSYKPAKHALWVITTPGIEAPAAAGTSVYMPIDERCR